MTLPRTPQPPAAAPKQAPEVISISPNEKETIQCPFCNMNITSMSADARNEHVDRCLDATTAVPGGEQEAGGMIVFDLTDSQPDN
jgi:MoaA/NifB/PqqE/SkfB family radical SAM enzyme